MRLSPTLLLAAALLGGACAARTPGVPGRTADEIRGRTGQTVRPPENKVDQQLPPDVSLDDGVSEEEAVAAALWGNAQLSADLSALGLARANLLEAGLLRNPSFQALFPVGVKPFELAVTWPLEAIFQRTRRVEAASREWEQIAEGLVQNGLNVARDARLAHSALLRAEQRARLSDDASKLADEIVHLTAARLRAGDVSEVDLRLAEAAAGSARETAVRAAHEVVLARERMRFQMGLPAAAAQEMRASASPAYPEALPPLDELREAAWSCRPDLRAQEIGVAAAAARARWQRSRWLVLSAVLSSKEVGTSGIRTGPGVSADIPVTASSHATTARADAEVEQASRLYIALRQKVDLEVSEAYERMLLAIELRAAVAGSVVPMFERAAAGARQAYESGDVSYLFFVEAQRQLLEARLRLADAEAAVRGAAAELDRSVGTRVDRLRRE
ncbi:MAG: TolC family protein [Vicinamibacterales bacterium]